MAIFEGRRILREKMSRYDHRIRGERSGKYSAHLRLGSVSRFDPYVCDFRMVSMRTGRDKGRVFSGGLSTRSSGDEACLEVYVRLYPAHLRLGCFLV